MNVSFSIDDASLAGLSDGLQRRFDSIRPQVEAWMAGRYNQIVLSNFGAFGPDRPWQWVPLSRSYAEEVGRTYATLYVTGHLMSSIKLDPEAATVSMSDSDCSYALKHHNGFAFDNLPARRVFPMDEQGNVTPFTAREVTEAAVEKIQELLR